MKVLNSLPVSSFGGLNFVIKETIDLKINGLLNTTLPALPKQSKYNWFDVMMSYWSIFSVEFFYQILIPVTGGVWLSGMISFVVKK